MKYRYLDYFGPDLNDGNHVFVFGSNIMGVHGAGAAKEARDVWGAKTGKGQGLLHHSYAIPTKYSWRANRALELDVIKPYVAEFLRFATEHDEITFLITPIGTGFAGYTHADIAPLFRGAPTNCIFVSDWKEFLE